MDQNVFDPQKLGKEHLQSYQELPKFPLKGKRPTKAAMKGSREAYWEEYGSFRRTPLYEEKLLESGNILEGPAIIEAEDTTTVVPPGVKVSIDHLMNMVLEKL